MKLQLRHLDALIWTLIYGGLLTLVLGIFTAGRAASLGWALMLGGGGVALVGLVLIFVRAHLGQQGQRNK